MKISRITLLALAVNRLIDSGTQFSTDEVSQLVENRTVLDVLQKDHDDLGIALDGVRLLNQEYHQDKEELLDALGRLANVVIPEDLGIDNPSNGLLFFNAMLNELIQANIEDIKLG